jgi:hypothetical protein
MIAVL